VRSTKLSEGFPFALEGCLVHVWAMRTSTTELATRFELLLDRDEKMRARRLRCDEARNSFVIVRGALRILLGRYLRCSPAEVHIQYGPKGKPALGRPGDLQFNVSHSHGLAVLAFTHGCGIGVDVEEIKSHVDIDGIAERFFCPAEVRELQLKPQHDRQRIFFLCWTRKEAYLKAIGDGLSAPLDDFCVELEPTRPARFLHIAGSREAAKDWTLHNLALAPGYAGALAYQNPERPVLLMPTIDPSDLLADRV
jgi:4'-phosphopantetheinyl transferase